MRSATSAGQVRFSDAVSAGDRTVTGGFHWSCKKLQTAAYLLTLAAVPAFACVLSKAPTVRCAALGVLVMIAWASAGLSRRVAVMHPVLVVDGFGITDTRLGLGLRWQDIAAIWPVATSRAQAIDIELRWADGLLCDPCLRTRAGARIQRATGLPGVTLNFWLLDGSVASFLAEVRKHRPDLLARCNRTAGDRSNGHATG